MKAILKIECIGDYAKAKIELGRKIIAEILTPELAEAVIGKFPSHYFVAEVTGFDEKYGYKRQFVRCKKDYLNGNGVGSRGVFAFYVLSSGKIYDIKEPKSWKKSDRYFCTINDSGDIIKLTKNEVNQCLRNHLE